MGKSKKQKESEELHRIWLEARGLAVGDAASSSKEPAMNDDDGDGDDEIPMTIVSKAGTLLIYAQNDVDFEDVPTSVLKPTRAKRSESIDADRFVKWFLERECKKNDAVVEKLERSQIIHARNHFSVGKAAERFGQMSGESEGQLLTALDTEGSTPGSSFPAMLQLSAKIENYEYNVVFQLHSDMAKNLPQSSPPPSHFP